ncbi:hypothetical protein CAL26_19795 [Bordetella genomosp. 9]|uniref:Peptidase n=1 Tax=Bordetella genomosp. 9 TaxID=1416803 RepID=A0A261R4C2_9BORD|nr:PepSY-associated TM helix domain-containing protein [Bordetella genomosp. 9]OZI19811.1 hypothetical protein CAL26_19795 [Bordetella genomosp. 9]
MTYPSRSIESPAGQAPAARSRAAGRRLWFELHSWIGLKLCVLLSFIFCTGTLAVIATEIDWVIEPAMRVTPQEGQASWGQMVAAAQQAHPDLRLRSLGAPHAERFAAQALMRKADGELLRVWVDPHTGQVTGESTWWSVQRWLRDTHRRLMLPNSYGLTLVTALSIPLLLMLVSSLFIYKRWWRGFLVWPRKGKPRLTWGDVHRLTGVWSLGFMALVGATGAWYLIESLGGDAPRPPVIAQIKGQAKHATLSAANVDRAVSVARDAWPALQVTNVRLTPDGKRLLIEGQAEGWLLRERANVIAVDIATGEIAGRNAGTDMTAHQRIAEMADPLHFGTFGGWPVRWLWFAFGLMLTSLSLTGAYLYGIRATESARAALKRTGIAVMSSSRWAVAWRGMGMWRWACLGLLAAWFVLMLMGVSGDAA